MWAWGVGFDDSHYMNRSEAPYVMSNLNSAGRTPSGATRAKVDSLIRAASKDAAVTRFRRPNVMKEGRNFISHW